MSTGYEFVPFPDKVRRVERDQVKLDRYVEGTYSGKLELTFVAEQPVHVGSGFKALVGDDVVRTGALVRGGPGIPGSSMKGALRSRYEAITKSCAMQAPKAGKVRSSSHKEIKKAFYSRDVQNLPVFTSCDKYQTCTACALFGLMSQRSRITVVDFTTDCDFEIESMPAQFGPNAHHLGTWEIEKRDQKKQFKILTLEGRKFAIGEGPVAAQATWQKVEVIPKGTLILGSLLLRNILPEELGGLLVVLGKHPESSLKIGAGKGNARDGAMPKDPSFGRIRIRELKWQLNDHRRSPIIVDDTRLIAWRRAFENSADRWKDGEEALVRIHQGGC